MRYLIRRQTKKEIERLETHLHIIIANIEKSKENKEIHTQLIFHLDFKQ